MKHIAYYLQLLITLSLGLATESHGVEIETTDWKRGNLAALDLATTPTMQLAKTIDSVLEKHGYEFVQPFPKSLELFRYCLDGIKDLYLDAHESPQNCVRHLNKLDFSDDRVLEIDVERLEGAALYLALKDPTDAMRLLDYNIQSKNIEFAQRVFSLTFLCFSEIPGMSSNCVQDRLILLNDCPKEDLGSLISLVVLFNKVGEKKHAQEVWSSRSRDNALSVENWDVVREKMKSLGLWTSDMENFNPYECQNIEEFCPLWEKFYDAHTKRNIGRFKRQNHNVFE